MQEIGLKDWYNKYIHKQMLEQSISKIKLANSQTQFADSQTQLAMLQNDDDLLYQAYEAHRTQHNIFKS